MGELADEQRVLEKLPPWVPDYLAAWGSRFGPDGKRIQVRTAARLAGTTEENVRQWRRLSPRFQMLEHIARFGGSVFLSSYMEAGIRTMAPELLAAFRDLVDSRNPQVVIQGMKWALNKTDVVDLNLRGVMATDDVSELDDDELDARLAELFDKARARTNYTPDEGAPAAGGPEPPD